MKEFLEIYIDVNNKICSLYGIEVECFVIPKNENFSEIKKYISQKIKILNEGIESKENPKEKELILLLRNDLEFSRICMKDIYSNIYLFEKFINLKIKLLKIWCKDAYFLKRQNDNLFHIVSNYYEDILFLNFFENTKFTYKHSWLEYIHTIRKFYEFFNQYMQINHIISTYELSKEDINIIIFEIKNIEHHFEDIKILNKREKDQSLNKQGFILDGIKMEYETYIENLKEHINSVSSNYFKDFKKRYELKILSRLTKKEKNEFVKLIEQKKKKFNENFNKKYSYNFKDKKIIPKNNFQIETDAEITSKIYEYFQIHHFKSLVYYKSIKNKVKIEILNFIEAYYFLKSIEKKKLYYQNKEIEYLYSLYSEFLNYTSHYNLRFFEHIFEEKSEKNLENILKFINDFFDLIFKYSLKQE